MVLSLNWSIIFRIIYITTLNFIFFFLPILPMCSSQLLSRWRNPWLWSVQQFGIVRLSFYFGFVLEFINVWIYDHRFLVFKGNKKLLRLGKKSSKQYLLLSFQGLSLSSFALYKRKKLLSRWPKSFVLCIKIHKSILAVWSKYNRCSI